MVDVNPNASSLQARLQAQLQSTKTAGPRDKGVDLTPRPSDIIDERIKARGEEGGNNRRLPVKLSDRSNQLSSAKELAQAKARVNQVAANSREAPVGRTSTRENELRNQPLGQIIDIRV